MAAFYHGHVIYDVTYGSWQDVLGMALLVGVGLERFDSYPAK